ncbi:MAG TPA: sigma-70 family RNA polymerase sigma factor [Solirubrobacteraceae bacterium]|nr:sigma-70 family RNA polymerase sigma factor [Solirubrobacteraceae bacterium]
MDGRRSGRDTGAARTEDLFAAWAHRHDPAARAELIERHLPLARHLAQRYVQGTANRDDLIQVASVGLIHAVERFDPDRGTAFSSFAVPTILGELKRYFRDTGWALHVDRRTQERATTAAGIQRALSARGEPTDAGTVARHMGCDETEVREALAASGARNAASLDAPATGRPVSESTSTLSEVVGAEDPELEALPDRTAIAAAIRHLPLLERHILALRFGEDLPQREIARRVGISQMHVSRLLRRSLSELRERVNGEGRFAA